MAEPFTIRYNFYEVGGRVYFCRGEHHKSADCEWSRFTEDHAEQLMDLLREKDETIRELEDKITNLELTLFDEMAARDRGEF